jgi:FkbM family methyltransferase
MFRSYSWLVRNKIIKTEISGVNYNLDLGEMIDLCIYLDRYEKDVTSAIKKYCKPGMNVIDIGANVGAHALTFGRIIGKQGQVFAFEPSQYAYNKLIKNINLNTELPVSPVHLALADIKAHSVQINYRSSWRTFGNRLDFPCLVDFDTLDSWCLCNSINNIDLIKIDVDGNEYPIFAGGSEVLLKHKPIILMEVVGPHLKSTATNPLIFLSRIGYRFFDIKSEEEISLDQFSQLLSSDDTEMHNSVNIIARVAS